MTTDAPDADAMSTTEAPATRARLLVYALAWREAVEIADASRGRLYEAVLQEIKAGLSVTEASQLTSLSRMVLHKWLCDGQAARPRPNEGSHRRWTTSRS